MATQSSNSDNDKIAFKLFGKEINSQTWFWILSIITIVCGFAYLIIHLCDVNTNCKKMIVKFSKEQTITLTSILANTDTIKKDSVNQICEAKGNIKRFIFTSFQDFPAGEETKVEEFIDSTCITQLKILLPDYPFWQRSFFWLNSDGIFYEIIFWSIFGVLCNLLYSTSEYIRKGEFDMKEVFVQAAKIFYAPFCVIIIYICYNQVVSTDAEIDVKYSMYSIAVAFLLGFFTGRMIELLNRLKDVLLPATPQPAAAATAATAAAAATATNDPNPEEVDEEKPETEKDIIHG